MSQQSTQPESRRKPAPELAYAFGRTGTAVTGVTLRFPNGKHVKATVENGWYFAWWPWAGSPISARVATTSGQTTMPLKH